jgi:hypothetical protein
VDSCPSDSERKVAIGLLTTAKIAPQDNQPI